MGPRSLSEDVARLSKSFGNRYYKGHELFSKLDQVGSPIQDNIGHAAESCA